MHTNDIRESRETAETDQELDHFQSVSSASRAVDGFDDRALPGDVSSVIARPTSVYGVSALGTAAIHGHEISHPVRILSHLAYTQQTLTRTTRNQLRQELRRGWRAILSLSIEDAFEIASTIEPALADLPHHVSGPFLSEIQVLRAVGFALSDHSSTALALADRAQKGPLAPRLRRLAATVRRYSYWKSGSTDKLYTIHQNRPVNRVSRRITLTDVFDQSIEAAAELQQLKMNTAKRLAGDAFESAQTRLGDMSTAGSFAAALVGQIAYEEGDLDRAERALRRILQPPQDRFPIECLVRAYPICARIAVHRGKPSDAIRILMEGEKLGEAKDSARLIAICLQERVDIYIDSDALDDARTCVERLSTIARCQHRKTCGRRSLTEMHCTLAAARLKLAATPSHSEAAVLRQLHQDALEWNDLYASIGLALRLVEALQIIGEAQDAASILARALRLAMNTGIFQTFIDGGRHVRALLIGMHQNTKSDQPDLMPFLSSVVRRLPVRPVQRCLPQPAASAKKVLTQRECHIMQLIGHGLSNKHIARELRIAPETVKSHAKHIFVKLSVQTRAEAVARAARLRLI
jgi:ATP/maltotriose-dependent transcriptional regulator MalT